MDSHLISANCTGPSQDPDWHQARVEQSALALVLAGDSLLFCRALGGPMGAVAVSVDCPQQLCLSITLQGFVYDPLCKTVNIACWSATNAAISW